MKRSLLSMICALLVFVTGFSQDKPVQSVKKTNDKVVSKTNLTPKQVEELRKKHAYHLANNKVNKKFNLSKAQRKAEGLPPNKANEQEWLLSMNPATGRPTPENLETIRQDLEKLRQEALASRIPGDAVGNDWVERGPNNVGGRTKALIFDPVAGGNAVIAGGVSGGLWKNADITNAATVWQRVTTFPEHINVQSITVDPLSTSTWYVGTGESYVGGDVNGNGIWKTTNAGSTWTRVFGGGTVSTTQSAVYNLQIVSPSNPGVVRGYISVQAAFGPGITDPLENYPIVLVNDGNATAPSTLDDGCTTPQNLAGKIALIRRGNCNFTVKVQNAELQGAVGVIVMNNGPAGIQDPIIMGGTDPGITIPSLMISGTDGNLLLANLANLTGSFIPTNVGEFTGDSVANVHFINDIAIKNNGGVSEIYAAVGDGYYGDASRATYFNATNYGLYKSTNGGSTWTKLTLPDAPSGNVTCPFDIEVSANGDVWVSSTDSWTFGDGGGKVFRSQDNGTSFAQMYNVIANGGGSRVEIEPAPSDQNTMYILSELNQADSAAPTIEVQLLRSVNATTATPTFTEMALPVSVYSSATPAPGTREYVYGFTGAQAFYDLMIECDPTNKDILYVGGIDLFRTTTATTGTASTMWTQISQWKTNVHSDQHALTFKPGSPNVGVFGNDGGVYYGSSLSTANNAVARNTGFNVTQFVGLAVKPIGGGTTGDFFIAGAQDNGSNYFPLNLNTTTGATAGVNGSIQVQGGDGGKPLFKQNATTVSGTYYVANYVYNDDINTYSLNGSLIKSLRGTNPATQGAGDLGLFYPAMTLDSANDIVYSDAVNSVTPTYQICRYTSIIGGGNASRAYLTNALITTYPTALICGKATPANLYVGLMNGKLLRITGANAVAAAIPAGNIADISGSGFVGSVSDIEFGANDSEIFVTMHNYGVNNIWYTRNGGTNWYRLDGNLPDMPVKAFLQNPLNTAQIMIGTELGVWYADTFNPATNADQALTWKPSFNGMMNVKVTDLDIQPNSPTAPTAYNVFAATYGRGVFSGALTATLANNQNEIANNSIKVFPTVSNGNVTIASDKAYGKTNVELFDITGKKVFANIISINSDAQQVNFGTLSAGNYILKLKGEGFEGTQKLIIN